jgi:MFS family permease
MTKSWRRFLIIWLTQGLSSLGSAMTYYAMIFWLMQSVYSGVEQKEHLAFSISVLAVSTALPGMLAAPLMGVWVDRGDRRRLMLWMDFLQAALLIVMSIGILTLTSKAAFWLTACVLFVQSLAGTVHSLAFGSSIVFLVEEKDLPRANGLLSVVWTSTAFAAPFMAALLYSTGEGWEKGWGIPVVLGLDILTYILGGLTLVFVRFASPRYQKTEALSFLNEWRDGIRYLRTRRFLQTVFTIDFLVIFAFSVEVLLPLFAKEFTRPFPFGWSESFVFSLLETAGFAGGTLASLFLVWRNWQSLDRIWMVLGVSGLLLIFFGWNHQGLIISLILYLLVMFHRSLYQRQYHLIFQRAVPPEMQGRIFGLRRFLSYPAGPLAVMFFGWLGGKVTSSSLFVGSGVVILMVSLVLMGIRERLVAKTLESVRSS